MIEGMRLAVHPGDGLVGRFGNTVLVVAADGVGRARTGQIIDICRQSAQSGDGRLLARRLAGLLAEAQPDDVGSFCALAPAPGGLAVILHGDLAMRAGETTLSGRESATWVDRVLPGPLDFVAVGAGSPAGGHHFNLREGVVPGVGLSLISAGSPSTHETQPAPATVPVSAPVPPAPVVAPAPSVSSEPTAAFAPPGPEESPPALAEPFQAVSLVGGRPNEPRPPLPVLGAEGAQAEDQAPAGPTVQGIVCSRGHFNNPKALYCSSCGISTVQQTRNLQPGVRPPLGIIVLDDGSTYSLDSDYVFGWDPSPDPVVVSGQARAVVLRDAENTIWQMHTEIRLQGWDVAVVDRGSPVGTFVYPPGSPGWVRLAPDTPTPVRSGTYVLVGRRTLVFDSHHER